MVDFKNVYDQALIHFALICEKSSKGYTCTSIITNSILSKIDIGSTHTFKNP